MKYNNILTNDIINILLFLYFLTNSEIIIKIIICRNNISVNISLHTLEAFITLLRKTLERELSGLPLALITNSFNRSPNCIFISSEENISVKSIPT